MDLKPPPTIFDVDQRGLCSAPCCNLFYLLTKNIADIALADADVLTPVLFRLTNTTELPILLIGGSPVGSIDTIRELNIDGKLKTLIIDAGGVPASERKPKRGRR
jgi:hypothetical protein